MTQEELLAIIEEAKQTGQTSLDLSCQQIKKLPETIGQLTNLATLDLSSNQLTALPDSIGELTQLKSLSLNENQLTTLSSDIGKLIKLDTLDLSRNKLKILPDEIKWLKNLSDLDLSENQLVTIPNVIGELSRLRYLYLQSNKLLFLPDEIGQLRSLTILDIGTNYLTSLPNRIGELISLTYLNASANQLASLPSEIGKLVNLNSIDLGINLLLSLPDEIGQLVSLESLHLLDNPLKKLPKSVCKLSQLTSLSLRGKKLVALPEWIGQLTNLVSLDLSHNMLTTLPDTLRRLTGLNFLDISFNQLTILPKWIEKLIDLTNLNLQSNQLAVLPDQICKLTNLKIISLRDNKLDDLPEGTKKISGLQSLDISFNQVIVFPPVIEHLHSLSSLDASSNQLSALPEWIGSLTELKQLYLGGNKLIDLPTSIKALTNLNKLYLNDNQLTILPESIGLLSRLSSFDIGCCNLKILPKSIGRLNQLVSLKLCSNSLAMLPESIGELVNLQTLDIENNPLNEIPPEVVKNGGLAVRDYYRQRLEEQTDEIYEAKLIVVGAGGAGKTSLANKLIDSNYTLKIEGSNIPEKSTEGIDILRLNFPHSSGNPFRINIWDFGGQEIYHATHQFFLTKRSLYLLVADARQENTDFNYWLEVIELLSDASPALIIKNEKQDRPCEVNENQLRGRFPNLEKILPTNLATNRGLPETLTAIQHHISQLPHIGTPLPKTWVNVRKALETDPRNHIPQTEFLTLCDTHGFKRHEDKLQLSGYLHDLGVCLHFQDDDLLQRTIILKPEWGTTAVYKVLDTPQVRSAFGHFTSEDLKTIWADEQYAEMRPELLQLMKNFKLCYEIPHRPKTYIAPQLLSPNQPDYPWNETDNLILRYEYDFMPKGMLTRFIVEMHRLIDNGLVWKEGAILTQNNARAEVIETYYNKVIRIRISGQLKKPLLEAIRHEFSKIHDSYERLRYQEFIPCNCSTCKGSQTPHSYHLKRLEKRLKNQRDTIECDISYQQVIVRNLLDDTIGQTDFPKNFSFRSDRYTEETLPSTTITINTGNSTVNNQSQRQQNFHAPVGVVANDNAQVTNFTQNNNANAAELLQIIATLRQTATQFPKEIQDELTIDIDDVETELQKPEPDRNPTKLKKRLIALATAGTLIATPIASMTDFTNTALDLATKLGIELPRP